MATRDEVHEYVTLGALVIVGGAAVLLFVSAHYYEQNVESWWQLLYAVWSIGVPCLFFAEYFLFGVKCPLSQEKVEHMKHFQQLGVTVWLAIAAVLGSFFLQG